MENQTTKRVNPVAQALVDIRAHCPEACKRVPEGELALALAMFRALNPAGKAFALDLCRGLVDAQQSVEAGGRDTTEGGPDNE